MAATPAACREALTPHSFFLAPQGASEPVLFGLQGQKPGPLFRVQVHDARHGRHVRLHLLQPDSGQGIEKLDGALIVSAGQFPEREFDEVGVGFVVPQCFQHLSRCQVGAGTA